MGNIHWWKLMRKNGKEREEWIQETFGKEVGNCRKDGEHTTKKDQTGLEKNWAWKKSKKRSGNRVNGENCIHWGPLGTPRNWWWLMSRRSYRRRSPRTRRRRPSANMCLAVNPMAFSIGFCHELGDVQIIFGIFLVDILYWYHWYTDSCWWLSQTLGEWYVTMILWSSGNRPFRSDPRGLYPPGDQHGRLYGWATHHQPRRPDFKRPAMQRKAIWFRFQIKVSDPVKTSTLEILILFFCGSPTHTKYWIDTKLLAFQSRMKLKGKVKFQKHHFRSWCS